MRRRASASGRGMHRSEEERIEALRQEGLTTQFPLGIVIVAALGKCNYNTGGINSSINKTSECRRTGRMGSTMDTPSGAGGMYTGNRQYTTSTTWRECEEPGGWNRIVLQTIDLPACIAALMQTGVRFGNDVDSGPARPYPRRRAGARRLRLDRSDSRPAARGVHWLERDCQQRQLGDR